MATIISARDGYLPLGEAAERLRAGMPVAIPTETVYGLAADATDGEAVARVYAMKGRPSFNPLICHVDGLVMAQEHGLLNATAERLARHFWPGPLTIVVPKRPNSTLSELTTAGLETVALRCPRGLARQVISAFGRPLAAPSANKSGKVSPTTAQHVAEDFAGEDLLILDGGPCPVGLESTIVRVSGDTVTLLRPGVVTPSMIEDALGVAVQAVSNPSKVEAPGMLASHYAPVARVKLNCETCAPGEAWLGFGKRAVPAGAIASANLSTASNLTEAAVNLYAHLKLLDASGAKTICVAPIPEEDLGVAMNDRLRRAAAPRENASEVA